MGAGQYDARRCLLWERGENQNKKREDQGSHTNAPEKVELGSPGPEASEPQSAMGNTLLVQARLSPKCSGDVHWSKDVGRRKKNRGSHLTKMIYW